MSIMMIILGAAAASGSGGVGIPGHIGVPGTRGFGVGICPNPAWLSELGLSVMEGTTDPTHENYGNYKHTNGGISVFVPKFFYKIGEGTPGHPQYGLNSIHVVGIDAYADEASANANGYALHRAFINNGNEQPGFFYDKYLASKDGTTSCKSVKNAHPISLSSSAGYEPSSGMVGCTGILADALTIARGRGYGWNAPLVFMADAIAKLSLAHGQAATSASLCAWYDAAGVRNFPKGCNSNLKDINDPTVTFTAAIGAKPLTGSASNLAKTTHNGQACGIADVNGGLYELVFGMHQDGDSPTSSGWHGTGGMYVANRATKFADWTGGWNGAKDVWRAAGNYPSSLWDVFHGYFFPWSNAAGWVYLGNNTQQVFSGATSGMEYLKSCCGIPIAIDRTSSGGTALFGNDGIYRGAMRNLATLVWGGYDMSSTSGIFYRSWGQHRSSSDSVAGFRAAAYGS